MLGITGIVLVLLVAVASFHQRAAIHEGRQLLRELEAEHQAWIDTVANRPPVRGAGAAGDAWECYVSAFSALRDLPDWPTDTPRPAPPPQAFALADAIRAGAECREARYRARQWGEISRWCGGIFAALRASPWCARHALAEGRVGDAVERALDQAWFGADLMRAGDLFYSCVGRNTVWQALEVLATALEAADARERARLRLALRSLEDHLPGAEGDLILRDAAGVRNAVDGCWWLVAPPGASLATAWHAWLQAVLRQPVDLIDLPLGESGLRRLRHLIDGDWTTVQQLLDEQDSRPRLGAWLAVSDLWQARPHDPDLAHHRTVLASLRLLRAAAGEPIEALPDPFGNGRRELRRRIESDRVVLWSVGPDGRDDGGPTPVASSGFTRPTGHAPGDLVLVTPRRE